MSWDLSSTFRRNTEQCTLSTENRTVFTEECDGGARCVSNIGDRTFPSILVTLKIARLPQAGSEATRVDVEPG
jgi:hypothetical protein